MKSQPSSPKHRSNSHAFYKEKSQDQDLPFKQHSRQSSGNFQPFYSTPRATEESKNIYNLQTSLQSDSKFQTSFMSPEKEQEAFSYNPKLGYNPKQMKDKLPESKDKDDTEAFILINHSDFLENQLVPFDEITDLQERAISITQDFTNNKTILKDFDPSTQTEHLINFEEHSNEQNQLLDNLMTITSVAFQELQKHNELKSKLKVELASTQQKLKKQTMRKKESSDFIALKNNDMQKMQMEIQDRDQQIAFCQEQLTSKDQEIATLQKLVTNQEYLQLSRDDHSNQKKNEADKQNNSFLKNNQIIAKNQCLLKELSGLEREYSTVHSKYTDLKTTVSDRDKSIKEYRYTLKLQELKLQAYRDQVNKLEKKCAMMDQENEELAQQQVQLEIQMQYLSKETHSVVEHPRHSPKGKKPILIKIEEPENESSNELSFEQEPINDEQISYAFINNTYQSKDEVSLRDHQIEVSPRNSSRNQDVRKNYIKQSFQSKFLGSQNQQSFQFNFKDSQDQPAESVDVQSLNDSQAFINQAFPGSEYGTSTCNPKESPRDIDLQEDQDSIGVDLKEFQIMIRKAIEQTEDKQKEHSELSLDDKCIFSEQEPQFEQTHQKLDDDDYQFQMRSSLMFKPLVIKSPTVFIQIMNLNGDCVLPISFFLQGNFLEFFRIICQNASYQDQFNITDQRSKIKE